MTVRGIGKPAGCKLIRLRAELEAGVIRSIAIHGDFFAVPEEGFERVEAALSGTPLAELEVRFRQLLEQEGVEAFGITGAGLAEVLSQARKED